MWSSRFSADPTRCWRFRRSGEPEFARGAEPVLPARRLPAVKTFDQLFAPPLLEGGYRKKYYRAISRLVALAREGAAQLP